MKRAVQTQEKEKVREHLAAVKRTIVRKLRSQWGRSALLDLANLGDHDCERFRKRWGVFVSPDGLDDGRILGWRDQLKKVWDSTWSAGPILDSWIREVPYKRWHVPLWVVDVSQDDAGRFGSDFIEPNPAHLGFVLALTIRDFWTKLGHCPNPLCPHPYFIKARKSQRFCDRPACTAYGQREHKRRWWSEHGEEWRGKREKVRKSSSKRHRKGGR